jgi:dihydrofolate reductase
VPKPIHCIVAVARNGVIGLKGRLPWHLPPDLAWFMRQTEGGVMIEGPACYAELGRALMGRGTVVVTRDESKVFPGAEVARNLTQALAVAEGMNWAGPTWITGGERIYAEGLPWCSKLYITHLERDFEGDRYFPLDWKRWFSRCTWSQKGQEGDLAYRFEVWET